MKSFIQLFAIYMLALSLMPCGDGGGGIVEIINHAFEVEHLHHAGHEDHSNNCSDDACSPFCICSCCSTSIDTPTRLKVSVKSPKPAPVSNPSFIPNFISAAPSLSIWQPPRYC